MMRLTLLSRASDLALVQARQVARALETFHRGLQVTVTGRTTTGDRDRQIALASASGKGLFTADLSDALASGSADLVVHSWKDLPVEERPDTVVAGTLERADPRDVLLVRADVRDARPPRVRVLTSSPRRAFQIGQSLPPLLPWSIESIEPVAVRGNVPTRMRKLVDGQADGLIVAKPALDRLLGDDVPDDARRTVGRLLDDCLWMVLPIREFPTAPAQGALAIEAARNRPDIIDLIRAVTHRPTADAVAEERRILGQHGGGCHQAFGATVLPRAYGRVRSVRGSLPNGDVLAEWALERPLPQAGHATMSGIWPRPDERHTATREALEVGSLPPGDFWVTRSEALPSTATLSASQLVWVAGSQTWRKLAARGVWVRGSAEGLGDTEAPRIDRLAGRSVEWRRLTHADSDAPGALATYRAGVVLPQDLGSRTHFFWTSGSLFREALAQFPVLRAAEHASGPGRTAAALQDALGPAGRVSIWLDYDEWLRTIVR